MNRVFYVEQTLEGWVLLRTEKDATGTWRNLSPCIYASKQAAKASGRQWKQEVRPVNRNR